MISPLQFNPILKSIRWGGTRLGTVLGKPIGAATDCAESWEVVDHGNDQSIVTRGPFAGWSLNRLVKEQGRALLGRHADSRQFPLLIKFLDAQDRLSVQVHPNDEQAAKYVPGENGKTEAWVVIDAERDSRLYAGLKQGIDRAELRRHVEAGTVSQCLHSFRVGAGDCVSIPAGTVHAIGEGVLLAEVQQSSDLTFRLDDWGRVGADGRPRELHIAQALECVDFERGPVDPVVPRPDAETNIEELVRTDCFVMRRYRGPLSTLVAGDATSHILMSLAGRAAVTTGDETTPICLGDSLLIAAEWKQFDLVLEEGACVLEATLP